MDSANPNSEKTIFHAGEFRLQIARLPIRLGQLLKNSNLVQDGFEAKSRITHGEVQVNDEVETRRGRQLHLGDIVTVDGQDYRICSA
ncbi:MAG: RNA-binding S4 domain-containing protein [Desulfopila sp.]